MRQLTPRLTALMRAALVTATLALASPLLIGTTAAQLNTDDIESAVTYDSTTGDIDVGTSGITEGWLEIIIALGGMFIVILVAFGVLRVAATFLSGRARGR